MKPLKVREIFERRLPELSPKQKRFLKASGLEGLFDKAMEISESWPRRWPPELGDHPEFLDILAQGKPVMFCLNHPEWTGPTSKKEIELVADIRRLFLEFLEKLGEVGKETSEEDFKSRILPELKEIGERIWGKIQRLEEIEGELEEKRRKVWNETTNKLKNLLREKEVPEECLSEDLLALLTIHEAVRTLEENRIALEAFGPNSEKFREAAELIFESVWKVPDFKFFATQFIAKRYPELVLLLCEDGEWEKWKKLFPREVAKSAELAIRASKNGDVRKSVFLFLLENPELLKGWDWPEEILASNLDFKAIKELSKEERVLKARLWKIFSKKKCVEEVFKKLNDPEIRGLILKMGSEELGRALFSIRDFVKGKVTREEFIDSLLDLLPFEKFNNLIQELKEKGALDRRRERKIRELLAGFKNQRLDPVQTRLIGSVIRYLAQYEVMEGFVRSLSQMIADWEVAPRLIERMINKEIVNPYELLKEYLELKGVSLKSGMATPPDLALLYSSYLFEIYGDPGKVEKGLMALDSLISSREEGIRGMFTEKLKKAARSLKEGEFKRKYVKLQFFLRFSPEMTEEEAFFFGELRFPEPLFEVILELDQSKRLDWESVKRVLEEYGELQEMGEKVYWPFENHVLEGWSDHSLDTLRKAIICARDLKVIVEPGEGYEQVLEKLINENIKSETPVVINSSKLLPFTDLLSSTIDLRRFISALEVLGTSNLKKVRSENQKLAFRKLIGEIDPEISPERFEFLFNVLMGIADCLDREQIESGKVSELPSTIFGF